MPRTFTHSRDSIGEPQLQSANLNTDKGGDILSEIEASPTRRRYEPCDLKDLTGHTFGTIPPDFKPVLTIPWTERPDQGISELAADLTIIERFTTVTQPEQSITTSIPPRFTLGTEIEIVTIIDGTKFIPPSSTSDVTIPSQESENSSLKDTTTKTTLLTSPHNRSDEGSSRTTSYTADSSTEFPPPSSSPTASETSTLSDTTKAIIGVSACICALFVAIGVFYWARRCLKGPKSRHREQHELQPEPRHQPQYEPRDEPRPELQNGRQYGPSANVSVTVCHNYAEIQPQQATVPNYECKA